MRASDFKVGMKVKRFFGPSGIGEVMEVCMDRAYSIRAQFDGVTLSFRPHELEIAKEAKDAEEAQSV